MRLNADRNLVGETLTGWTEKAPQGLSQSVAEKLCHRCRNLGDPGSRADLPGVAKSTKALIAGAQRERELRKSN